MNRAGSGGVLPWSNFAPNLRHASNVQAFDALVAAVVGNGGQLLSPAIKFHEFAGDQKEGWQIFYHMLVPEIDLQDGHTKRNEFYDETFPCPVIDLHLVSGGAIVLKMGWDGNAIRVLPHNLRAGSQKLKGDDAFARRVYQTAQFPAAAASLQGYALSQVARA